MVRKKSVFALGAVVVAAMVAGVSCGSDDSTGDTMSAAQGEVSVVGPWARNSPMAATVGAAYMVITSPVDDELVGIRVPESVAARTELHETVAMQSDESGESEDAEAGDGHGDGHGETHGEGHGGSMGGGMMTMRQVESIELPAGKMVMLQPGGLHIMLLDLQEPLELGSTFTATLEFAVGAPMEVEFEVRDTAP